MTSFNTHFFLLNDMWPSWISHEMLQCNSVQGPQTAGSSHIIGCNQNHKQPKYFGQKSWQSIQLCIWELESHEKEEETLGDELLSNFSSQITASNQCDNVPLKKGKNKHTT